MKEFLQQVAEQMRRQSMIDARIQMGAGQFNTIKSVYSLMHDEILESAKNGHWTDPYFIDWCPIFTPIESLMWGHIRDQNIPFYPQFPVGRFFVDFGNPALKLAIECDGRAYHDVERDKLRDAELILQGWLVARFSGSECYYMESLPCYDELVARAWQTSPSSVKFCKKSKLI